MATTLQKWQGVSQDFWQGASESDLIGLRNILRGIEHFQMCKSWRRVALVKTWQGFNCLCGNKGSFWGGRGVNNQWTGAVRRGIIPSISGLISCAVSCLLLCVLCSSVCCSLCSLVVGCPDGRPGGQHHVLFLTAYILPTHNLPASTSKQSRVRSVESQQQY